MTLTLPSAGITPGASADTRSALPDIGGEVRDFGTGLARIGMVLRQEQDDRAFSRAQLRMLEQFNGLELELAQIGDPDAMDATFRDRAPGTLGGQRPAAVPILDTAIADLPPDVRQRLAPRLDEAYERIRIGAAQGVGRSVLAQQQSAQMETLENYRHVSLNVATNPNASPEMALLSFEGFEAELNARVADGTITPEQRGDMVRGWARNRAQGLAENLFQAGDYEGLLAQIDGPNFEDLTPADRNTLRSRLTTALETRTREAGAALSQRLREGVRVLRAGYDYADAEALAADPAVAQTPEGREFLAALELHRARPDLARMTPAQQADLVAEVEGQPIAGGEGFETDQRAALRAVVAASTEAWTRDPLGHAAQLGMLQPVALPDPATADPADLYPAIRARAAQALALRDGGYTAAPVLLRPEERAAFAAVTGLDADPRLRARVAGDLVTALGPDAPALIGQFSDDPVFGYVGGMVAATGNAPLAAEVFEGQRALESRDVPLPSEATRRNTHFRLGLGEGGVLSEYADRALINQMIGAADALAARRLRGRDPAEIGEDAYFTIAAQALHEVMGGTGTRDSRDARGGIQPVNGAPTLLPMGVRGADVNAQLSRLAGALDQSWTATGPTILPQALDMLRTVSAGGGLPSIGGEPMDGRTLRSLVFQAAPDGSYHAFLDGQPLQVMTEDGTPWRLDMRALVEWQP